MDDKNLYVDVEVIESCNLTDISRNFVVYIAAFLINIIHAERTIKS